jgi:chemotaxis protein MotB
MRRKKRHAAHPNHERWLVSYADFITLLFAFFVVMFAASQADHGKAQQVQESIKRALEENQFTSAIAGILGGDNADKGKGNAQMHGPGGDRRLTSKTALEGRFLELLPAMNLLTRELEEELKKGRMQVTLEPRGLVVSFREAAFFPSGGDMIPQETYSTIQKVAEVVTRLPNPIRLEGHTDSIPIRAGGRFRSNWELSAARSIAMMEVLVEAGIPRDRVSIAGYAENAPVESNETAEGRMRNRRVDIVMLNKTGVSAEPASAARSAQDASRDAAKPPAAAVPESAN